MFRRQLQFSPQRTLELLENNFTNEEPVLGEHMSEKVRAQPSGSECGDEDVGVQKHSHEIERKTSSSVR